MSSKDTIVRKGRLTLTQLASYDDILTDVLVDHVSAILSPVHTDELTLAGHECSNVCTRSTFGPLFGRTGRSTI